MIGFNQIPGTFRSMTWIKLKAFGFGPEDFIATILGYILLAIDLALINGLMVRPKCFVPLLQRLAKEKQNTSGHDIDSSVH